MPIWGDSYERNLNHKTISGYFISYLERSKGYKFDCHNHTTRTVELKNAKFMEDHENSGSAQWRDRVYKEIRKNIELPNTQNGFVPLDIINYHQEIQEQQNDQAEHNIGWPINDQIPKHHDDPLPNAQPNPKLRRSTRVRRPSILEDYVVCLEEADIRIKDYPKTFENAIESVDSNKWLDAMKEEL